MKKVLFILVLSGFIGSCEVKTSPGSSNEILQSINIGAILPLTGDLSSYGEDTRKALELAVDQWNATQDEGAPKVKLIVEDDQGKESLAVSAFNRLVAVEKVLAILGPITSPQVLAVSPLAERKKTPILSPSSTSDKISKFKNYTFRTINADDKETIVFADFLQSKYGCLSMGIIANQAEGTASYADSFEDFYTQKGCPVLFNEKFLNNTKNFRTIIVKSLAEKPDALYITGVSQDIGLLIKQIREQDKGIPIFSYQSAEDARVVELAGSDVNGLVFSSTTIPDKDLGQPKADFNAAFKARYEKHPGIFAAEIYDGINVILRGIESQGEEGGSLVSHIKQTQNYPGASGEISFDANGDVSKPISIYQYENSKPKPIEIRK